MLLLVEIAVAVAIVFAVAALVVGHLDGLKEAPADRAEVALPVGRLLPVDVDQTRMGLVFRGYRMSEVDDVLDRLADELTARDGELALRDRELTHLRGRVSALQDERHTAAAELAAVAAELEALRGNSLEMPMAPKPYVTTSFPPIRDRPLPETEPATEKEQEPEGQAETVPAEAGEHDIPAADQGPGLAPSGQAGADEATGRTE